MANIEMKRPTTVAELNEFSENILKLIKAVLGDRSSAVIMVGMPIPNTEHDRFSAGTFGPCLSTRGLLAWGTDKVSDQIDAEDSSRNGGPHPSEHDAKPRRLGVVVGPAHVAGDGGVASGSPPHGTGVINAIGRSGAGRDDGGNFTPGGGSVVIPIVSS